MRVVSLGEHRSGEQRRGSGKEQGQLHGETGVNLPGGRKGTVREEQEGWDGDREGRSGATGFGGS